MVRRDLILHNFWWKLTSLFLAVIVWLVVYRDSPLASPVVPRNPYRFPKHPLAVLRDSTDKRAIRISPTEVDVTVSTPINEATRLDESDIQTFVDLSEVDSRQKSARIRVYVPRGVRLERIEPEAAVVEIME